MIETLGKKDKELISILDFNARTNYSVLSKKLGMSKPGVEYKISNLIKKDIICGFYPVIDLYKLGYIYGRLFIGFQNTSEKKEKEIIKYLIKQKKITWIIAIDGSYDYGIATLTRSLTEFKELIDEITIKFGPHIRDKLISVGTKIDHLNFNILDSKKTNIITIKETPEIETIDNLDYNILSQLCKNARMSLIELSQKINIKYKTISFRIKRMEKKGIIKGYRPIINQTKMGHTYFKLLFKFNKITTQTLNDLNDYLKNKKEVLYITESVGTDYDLDIEIIAKNNNEFFEFIKELKKEFPNVFRKYDFLIFTKTLKIRYMPERN